MGSASMAGQGHRLATTRRGMEQERNARKETRGKGEAAISSAMDKRCTGMQRRSKYGNRRVETDGRSFDSAAEYRRWKELKLLERAGEIYDLQCQVPFVLIPSQKDEKGKEIEKPVKYIADFTYREIKGNRLVVEDVKGMKTQEYIIKRKLMLFRLGIRIQEVEGKWNGRRI